MSTIARTRRLTKGLRLLLGSICFLATTILSISLVAASEGSADLRPEVARIELQVQSGLAENWAIVQWVDSAGAWHDIEGWSGNLEVVNGVGKKVWGVMPVDYHTGPFRWAVYDRAGGKVIGTSGAFFLPDGSGDTVLVEVAAVQPVTSQFQIVVPLAKG